MRTLLKPKVILAQLLVLLSGVLLYAVIFPSIEGAAIVPILLLAALCFLAISILTSVLDRIRRIRRQAISLRNPPAGTMVTTAHPDAVSMETLNAALPGRRHRSDDGTLVFTRGASGAFGSILFHLGLVVIIAGVVISYSLSESGSVILTEGESVRLDTTPFFPAAAEEAGSGLMDPGSVTLLRFIPEYSYGEAVTTASELLYTGASDTVVTAAYVNNGVQLPSMQLHHVNAWGYSPEIILIEDGATIFHGFIRLAWPAEGPAPGHSDTYTLPDGRRLQLRLYPDCERSLQGLRSRSHDLRRPVLELDIENDAEDTDTFTLGHRESETRGSTFVSFPSVRHWSQFDMRYDPGLSVLAIGSILCFIGLLVRILFVRKTIWLRLEKNEDTWTVFLAGRSEKYPASFEEELAYHTTRLQVLLQDARPSPTGTPQSLQ